MKEIVVATDGSDGAVDAARAAAQLAAAFDAHVTLVHVANLPPSIVAGVGAAPTLPEDYLDVTTAYARDRSSAVLSEAGVAHDMVVLHGSTADVIVDEAARRGADLIVVGRKGIGPVTRFLVGSVTDRIVHHATCNVLVVEPAPDADEDGD